MKFPPWTSVSEAARLLKAGEVVAIPTETVYGLAGNAFEPKALAKIFAAKERPTFDPLIVHIADIAQLTDIARDIPESAYRLADAYWPGPMTIILPKKDCTRTCAPAGCPPSPYDSRVTLSRRPSSRNQDYRLPHRARTCSSM